MKNTKRALSLALASASLAGGGAVAAAMPTAAHADQVTYRNVPMVLNYVRYCESRNNYSVVNYYGAAGAYQITKATWWDYGNHKYLTANKAPADIQDRAAINIYNRTGLGKWTASRWCWAPMYNSYLRNKANDNKNKTHYPGSSKDDTQQDWVEADYIPGY